MFFKPHAPVERFHSFENTHSTRLEKNMCGSRSHGLCLPGLRQDVAFSRKNENSLRFVTPRSQVARRLTRQRRPFFL